MFKNILIVISTTLLAELLVELIKLVNITINICSTNMCSTNAKNYVNISLVRKDQKEQIQAQKTENKCGKENYVTNSQIESCLHDKSAKFQMWQISIFQFKGILWSAWIMYGDRIPAQRFFATDRWRWWEWSKVIVIIIIIITIIIIIIIIIIIMITMMMLMDQKESVTAAN